MAKIVFWAFIAVFFAPFAHAAKTCHLLLEADPAVGLDPYGQHAEWYKVLLSDLKKNSDAYKKLSSEELVNILDFHAQLIPDGERKPLIGYKFAPSPKIYRESRAEFYTVAGELMRRSGTLFEMAYVYSEDAQSGRPYLRVLPDRKGNVFNDIASHLWDLTKTEMRFDFEGLGAAKGSFNPHTNPKALNISFLSIKDGKPDSTIYHEIIHWYLDSIIRSGREHLLSLKIFRGSVDPGVLTNPLDIRLKSYAHFASAEEIFTHLKDIVWLINDGVRDRVRLNEKIDRVNAFSDYLNQQTEIILSLSKNFLSRDLKNTKIDTNKLFGYEFTRFTFPKDEVYSSELSVSLKKLDNDMYFVMLAQGEDLRWTVEKLKIPEINTWTAQDKEKYLRQSIESVASSASRLHQVNSVILLNSLDLLTLNKGKKISDEDIRKKAGEMASLFSDNLIEK